MGAYVSLKKLLGDLSVIAMELNYPAPSICILNGKTDDLDREFPQTANNLRSCHHNKDSRSDIEYGRDLVASWIYEDYLMLELNKAGLEIKRSGADRNREILPCYDVSSDSDFLILYQGRERKLELMNDHKGYWEKSHKFHLRDNKYQKVLNSKSIFLGVSTFSGTYFLTSDISRFPQKYIPSHPIWCKPAQELIIPHDALKPINFNLISQEIITML